MKKLLGCAMLLSALMFITVGYATADLAEGLVLYFTFDTVKGKTIVDDSGNGLDADIIANTDIVKGQIRGCNSHYRYRCGLCECTCLR